ncbi:hypothetical protein A9Q78_01675 [Methylophaga sp. 41_12_T18]|nr:hypothetical protein A9Q78_01675 [Methylophaga sp. 41_12_T18]
MLKRLIAGMLLLLTTVVSAEGRNKVNKYCTAHANMTYQVFELRKVEGLSYSSFVSQVEHSKKHLNLSSRFFFTHAYSLPLNHSKLQVIDSAYKLCVSSYNELLAMN